MSNHLLNVICDILGWLYFTVWAISLYPQVILNYRRKCVIGLSFDYKAIYNLTGNLFYTIYTISTFIHHKGTSDKDNPIEINDIACSVHAFILTVICCIQILIYDRGDQKPSQFALYITVILWTICLYNIALSTIFNTLPWFAHDDSISTILFFGYVKICISPIKYFPQVWMNFVDKSTTGFSIHAVLLDFTGGTFSVLQQLLSALNTNDWSFITGNIPKFVLGIESIIFDIIFMIQHYILYGDNNIFSRQPTKEKEKAKLIYHPQVVYNIGNDKIVSSIAVLPSNSINSKAVLVKRRKQNQAHNKNSTCMMNKINVIDGNDNESNSESSTFSAGDNQRMNHENQYTTDSAYIIEPGAKGQWMAY
eukprot:227817_1